MIRLPRLHAVTDDEVLRDPRFVPRAIEVLEAGGGELALHLRGPGSSGRRLFDLAQSLGPEARRAGALLVVNDRVDVALACGADAVQLAGRSLDLSDVRAAGGRLRVGVSCHDTEEVAAGRARADWLVCGHVFETRSHVGQRPLGLDGLVALVAAAGTTPVVAIGGLSPSRVAEVLRAGASGVAVLGGIWRAGSPPAAASEYISALPAVRKRPT